LPNESYKVVTQKVSSKGIAMKKLLFIATLTAHTVVAHAQGQINLGNISNVGNNPSPTATTGGLFWLKTDFSGPDLITTDFNVNFYGGSDANSMVLLKSFVNSGGGAALGPGTFLDLSGVPVSIPGALSIGFFYIQAWVGSDNFFSAPYTCTSPVFSNPLGNPQAFPPGLPTDFTGMPALVLEPLCPEPGTFVLAGLGVAALLIFRRRR
jgi:hypothetical protein